MSTRRPFSCLCSSLVYFHNSSFMSTPVYSSVISTVSVVGSGHSLTCSGRVGLSPVSLGPQSTRRGVSVRVVTNRSGSKTKRIKHRPASSKRGTSSLLRHSSPVVLWSGLESLPSKSLGTLVQSPWFYESLVRGEWYQGPVLEEIRSTCRTDPSPSSAPVGFPTHTRTHRGPYPHTYNSTYPRTHAHTVTPPNRTHTHTYGIHTFPHTYTRIPSIHVCTSPRTPPHTRVCTSVLIRTYKHQSFFLLHL